MMARKSGLLLVLVVSAFVFLIGCKGANAKDSADFKGLDDYNALFDELGKLPDAAMLGKMIQALARVKDAYGVGIEYENGRYKIDSVRLNGPGSSNVTFCGKYDDNSVLSIDEFKFCLAHASAIREKICPVLIEELCDPNSVEQQGECFFQEVTVKEKGALKRLRRIGCVK